MGTGKDPANTLSVRFHLDARADCVEEINARLKEQGLVQIKASKAHIPLICGLKQTCSNDDIDRVLAKLCPALEHIAAGVPDFDFNFPGLGTFYNTGGRRDFGVVFLEPAMTPAITKAQSDCYDAVVSAIDGTQAAVDFYTAPNMWNGHLTIAKGIKRDVFSEVLRQVNQWALDGPFDHPEGLVDVFASTATCLALKVKNYKGTKETKVFEFKLARSSENLVGRERPSNNAGNLPAPTGLHLPCFLGMGLIAFLAGAAFASASRGAK